MIHLVISYLILSDWIKFKVSTRKFKETHTWWRTLFREDAVEKQISDKIVRNPRTHRIEFPSKLKQFLQSEIHMDQYQLSSQRSSLSPLPTMTSDTTWSWSSSCGLKVGGSNLVQCTMDQSSKDSQWIPVTNCQVEVQNKCFYLFNVLFDFRVGRHVTIVTMLWWSERAMAKKKFEMCDDQCWPLLWVTKLFKS